MKLSILGICYCMAVANAFCDVCIEGWCGMVRPLLDNAIITEQLAIDWKNSILYAQINLTMNTAFYIHNYAIKNSEIVQVLKTHGMAVDQDTQELYTAGHNNIVYKIKQGSNASEAEYNNGILNGTVYLLYFADVLYYTKHDEKGLFFVTSDGRPALIVDLANYYITDFVRTEKSIIFVSNDIVYEFKDPFHLPPQVIFTKNVVISVDSHDNIYLGDASKRIIYKRDPETSRLYIYAAYKMGAISQFVFDKFDDMITFDSVTQILAYWTKSNVKCTIEEAPCSLNINYNVSDVHPPLFPDLTEQPGPYMISDFEVRDPEFF